MGLAQLRAVAHHKNAYSEPESTPEQTSDPTPPPHSLHGPLPCQTPGMEVTNNCGNPSLKRFFDPSCSTSGGVGCNAGGVGQNCRYCDVSGAPPCPQEMGLAQLGAVAHGKNAYAEHHPEPTPEQTSDPTP